MSSLVCYRVTWEETDACSSGVQTVCVCGREGERQKSSYLVQAESADTESGQFYGVQQGHLGHTIGLCATTGPVLVTFNLWQRKWDAEGEGQTVRQTEVLAAILHILRGGVATKEHDRALKKGNTENFKSCSLTHQYVCSGPTHKTNPL